MTIDGIDEDATTGRSVKSSLRTLEILEYLSRDQRRQSVTTISRDLGIPKSSLHGLLRTMEARGWLETDATGTLFGLGLRALLTGNAFLESDDVVNLAEPVLDVLSDRTGETVHLGRLDGDDVVYLAKRESTHAIRLYSAVGRRLPAHATALGKVLLAEMSDAEVDARLSWPLVSLTAQTITSKPVLHRALAEIRSAGIGSDDGENSSGIRCLAVALAPFRGAYNALSCSVPESRMTPEHASEIADALREAARSLDAVIARSRF